MSRDEQRAMLRYLFKFTFGSDAVAVFERNLRDAGMSLLLVHNDDPRRELKLVFKHIEMIGGDDADYTQQEEAAKAGL